MLNKAYDKASRGRGGGGGGGRSPPEAIGAFGGEEKKIRS